MAATRTKYLAKKDNTKVINGYTFVLHHDNNSREKRNRNAGCELYAFWGHPHGVDEATIYWATKHIAR